jgi:hypothetical protein
MPIELPERIRAHAWRQGQVLPRQLYDRLVSQEGGSTAVGAVGVLITQSCNLVCRDLHAEPNVEVITGERIATANGLYLHGRNPRQLHLPIQTSGQQVFYEFFARNRLIFPREWLADAPCNPEYKIGEHDCRTLIAWWAARYERAALPDEFQRRLSPIQKKLRGYAKKLVDVPDLFIALNEWEDIGRAEYYEVALTLVMPTTQYNQPVRREAVQEIANEIERLLVKLEGISINSNVLIKPDDEFTLADLKAVKRWGDFDHTNSVED